MSVIYNTWPWYVAGPLIALTLLVLLKLGRTFGMSSNLRTLCSIGGAGKISEFFNFDWKKQAWNLWVVAGVIVGGIVAFQFLDASPPQLEASVVAQLQSLGFSSVNKSFLPEAIFANEALFSVKGFGIILLAGFLVGFGARYAGGCTSGHAISGLSNLQWPSLLAVIGFFAGGLLMIHVLFPLIF